MIEFLKKYYWCFILVLACIPLYFIGIQDTQPWGDDFAQYIAEAQNIANGNAYDQTPYVYNELNTEYAPANYPPGFPLLLAPVVKLFGISIRPMLYLNSFFLSLLLFVLFYYFRKHMGTISAFCFAVIAVYCGGVINLKWHVLSDIPLLLFTSMYLLLRQKVPISKVRLLLLVFVSVMAVLIRTQAILLVVSEMVLLFSNSLVHLYKHKFSVKEFCASYSIKILIGFIGVYVLVTTTLFPASNSTLNFYIHLFTFHPQGLWHTISENTSYLLELFMDILHYPTNSIFEQTCITLIEFSGLVFACIGWWFVLTKKLQFESLFFSFMCLMIILLPSKQGIRYLLPAVPVYLLFIKNGVNMCVPVFLSTFRNRVGGIVTLLYLALGTTNFNRIPYDKNWTPYQKEDSLAFTYIRKQVKDTEIIVFSKPRALSLFTTKKAMNLAWQVPAKNNKKKLDELSVKYILTRKGLDDTYILEYLKETRSAIDTQYIGNEYTLYYLR